MFIRHPKTPDRKNELSNFTNGKGTYQPTVTTSHLSIELQDEFTSHDETVGDLPKNKERRALPSLLDLCGDTFDQRNNRSARFRTCVN